MHLTNRRQQLMPYAIAEVGERCVGGIVHVGHARLADVGIHIGAGDPKQRTHDRRRRIHRGEPACACAAQDAHEDRLDLVELNDKFVDVLRRRLQHEPEFVRAADRVGIHHMAIQDFRAEAPYDYIISGLPINNFTADLVREMFEVMFGLLAPQGVLTYFEYIYMRKFKKNLSTGARRERLEGKVFGAGRVLPAMSDVGARNAQFALEFLEREHIEVKAKDVGGVHARKVYL